ncbi:Uncharacterised protein [uncultured archaeon]|nr:Uncharacterised protein [uncultured archaeon]
MNSAEFLLSLCCLAAFAAFIAGSETGIAEKSAEAMLEIGWKNTAIECAAGANFTPAGGSAEIAGQVFLQEGMCRKGMKESALIDGNSIFAKSKKGGEENGRIELFSTRSHYGPER